MSPSFMSMLIDRCLARPSSLVSPGRRHTAIRAFARFYSSRNVRTVCVPSRSSDGSLSARYLVSRF